MLITFGDGWTLGDGSFYKTGMPQLVYNKLKESTEYKDSWRNIVADSLKVKNINFASTNSSNQKQFSLAKNFFISKKFRDLYSKDMIVVWGISTLHRDFKWCSDSKKYEDIVFTDQYKEESNKDRIGYGLKKWCYNDSIAIKELEIEILHWNQYFKALGIKNYWFDTFNSKNYNIKPSNFFDITSRNRDLLSLLCIQQAVNNSDSYGVWSDDRFEYGVRNKFLTPYQYYPKKESHKKIAEYIIGKIT
ncbi:MAG: hypothetical protein CMG34_07620 [Candidatus Marinimicrobia bacterium]|nr:hypothetical protein [Candidatus Neomarinimicrobiota bacterium]|tara:strand:+ start:899 stop:1639 length:741 start_codon:yes stop_codon:yes gene_type:complete